MASDFTTAEATAIVNDRIDQYAYLGLLTGITSVAAGTVTEVSDTNYARQAISWGTAAAGAVATNTTLTFPAAVAGYTVVGIGIYAGASGGSPVWVKSVTSQAVATGNQYEQPSGTVTITFS
jgi:pimeloyl-ACP methyl ester carboxylesterase